jgi:hypothetical protein
MSVDISYDVSRFSEKLKVEVDELPKAGWDIRSAALTDELEPQGFIFSSAPCNVCNIDYIQLLEDLNRIAGICERCKCYETALRH